ncbi:MULTISPECIES: ATP-grasp domain-containing protein [Actinomadura]|uniref:RimK family alpha-L-glutamate ligase n=1 Tax=Actinomadura yumaensis TaxID=111807 RepID=A0ABW2CXN1_9ACTN|nr:ATP-grasp domain-containing protein [Actinomadura sp. J1-007]
MTTLESTVWVLVAKELGRPPELGELFTAFDQHLPGRWQLRHPDELLVAVKDGRLLVLDHTGTRLPPPRTVCACLASPTLHTDREITLLRQLSALGAVIVNPIDATLTAVNKFWQLQQFATHGLPMPDTVTYAHGTVEAALPAAPPTGPYVVKAVRGNRGKRVFLAPDRTLLTDISGSLGQDVPSMLQEYIENSHGRHLRIYVMDGAVVSTVERTARDDRLTSNRYQGATSEFCTGRYPAAEELATQAAAATGLVIAGVDILFRDEGTPALCEVNSFPGWDRENTRVPDAIARLIAARSN